ncbi:MAG: DUF1295 domain-containing protein [Pseudarcicella sp.]|nr:DUF1295 domain-containing protein [Pseudarcicella sp.]MBP6410273.1 DUF1295 domain-containing protein [Pseudarcicella sp.]
MLLTLSILWISFCLLQLLFATDVCRNIFKFGRYTTLFYTLQFVLILLPVLYFHVEASSEQLLPVSFFNKLLGGMMMASGVYLAYLSVKEKGFLKYLGLNTTNETDTFISEGLHGIVRYPLYLGVMLFLWGMFGFWGYDKSLLMAFVLSVYFVLNIYLEEKKLVKKHGKTYLKYQSEVPMLLPKF